MKKKCFLLKYVNDALNAAQTIIVQTQGLTLRLLSEQSKMAY